MGRHRKLPQSRKHKKLKTVDPANRAAQHALKFSQLKNANLPPVDVDTQLPSRGFEDFIIRAKKFKTDQEPRASKRFKSSKLATTTESNAGGGDDDSSQMLNNSDDRNAKSPTKTKATTTTKGDVDKFNANGEPVFKRRPHESKWGFIQRMRRAANAAVTKATIESRFGGMLKNVTKNQVTLEPDDRELLMESSTLATDNNSKDNAKEPKAPAPANPKKSLRSVEKATMSVTKRKLPSAAATTSGSKRDRQKDARAAARRDHACTKRENETFAVEPVAFGERNDRPPTLTSHPRLPKPKPITSGIMSGTNSENLAIQIQKQKVELRRQTVVDQYRQLKKLRNQQQNFQPLAEQSFVSTNGAE